MRCPERRARRDWEELEEIQLAAQPPVVATLRLLQAVQVLVQLGPRLEGGAVDALEHLPSVVASPVGAGRGQELEVLEAPRARDVRPLAQVEERAVLIDRDHLGVVELLQALELERIVGEETARLLLADAATPERHVRRGNLRHLGLERRQVVGREGRLDVEVVVEALLDGRPEADPGAWSQLAHRRGKNVGG